MAPCTLSGNGNKLPGASPSWLVHAGAPTVHLEVRPGGGDPVDPEVALAGWGIKP